MDINISLSFTEDEGLVERVKKATDKKAKATETIEDAWVRIFGMKNSDADMERLKIARNAMIKGRAGRLAQDAGKRFSKAEALRIWRVVEDSLRDERLRDMVENTPANYFMVDTEAKLSSLVADLYKEDIIAIDTETNGLDVFGDDRTVGMSITLPKADYHVYIPYGHTVGLQLDRDIVLKAVKPRLECGHLKKVLHNAKFDIHMLWNDGIELRGLTWDTMIAMHLLNENESLKLKDLATKYLNQPSDTFKTLFGKTKFNDIPLDIAMVYACKDTHITWELYQFQLKHFAKMPNVLKYYNEVENRIVEVSAEMERNGFVFDTERADELTVMLTKKLAGLEVELKRELGDINFNSPTQLSKVFYEDLKLKKYLPPKMKLSTDANALAILGRYNKGCKILLEYRESKKLLSTYIEALPKQIKADGRIHGNFNQTGTVTGRYSSNNPNLQNQPQYARKLFVAPKGMVIIGGDFSQQEPRLLAHFSQEEALILAYQNGEDLYATMASRVFKLDISLCGDGSKYRKMMKFGVLSVMYGTGPKTLAGQLGITVDEAEAFIEDFYVTFPKVTAWIESNKEYARKHGFVWMIDELRKRRLTGVKSKDKWERFRAERQATNAIIQGSASVQTKRTMIALSDWCAEKRANGRNFMLCATVHDEVLIYAPLNVTREEVEQFNAIMVETMTLCVPNKSDVELMTRWGEGVSIDEWFNTAV